MAAVTELELLTYLFNPKLYNFAKSNIKYLKSKYQGAGNVNARLVHILDSVENIDKYTQTEFGLDCRTMQLSDDVLQLIDGYYQKGLKLTDNEITKATGLFCNLISQEVISMCSEEFSDSPEKFIKEISKFNPESIVSISSDFRHGMKFSEMPLDTMNDSVCDNVLKSSIPMINEHMGAGGYQEGTLTCISAKPGLGKSLYAMQETLGFLRQGKKVWYAAIGDLNEIHFMTRLSAMGLGIPLTTVLANFKWFYKSMLQSPDFGPYMQNLYVDFLQPDKITCAQYIAELKVKGILDEYDCFIFDYDESFASETEYGDETMNMYEKHGNTYNALKDFIQERPSKFAFILSQPKPAYYNAEEVPLEALAESSKKAKIVDHVITLGNCRTHQNNLTNICLVKNRNGSLGHTYALIDRDVRFQSISEDMYYLIKGASKQITFNKSVAMEENQISIDTIREQYEANMANSDKSA